MVGDGEEARILVDAVEEIGLFIIVRGEDDVVYNSLEDLLVFISSRMTESR